MDYWLTTTYILGHIEGILKRVLQMIASVILGRVNLLAVILCMDVSRGVRRVRTSTLSKNKKKIFLVFFIGVITSLTVG